MVDDRGIAFEVNNLVYKEFRLNVLIESLPTQLFSFPRKLADLTMGKRPGSSSHVY